MFTGRRKYIPLLAFIPFLAVVSAWAISEVKPTLAPPQEVAVSDKSTNSIPYDIYPPFIAQRNNPEDLDISELNRRLVAEGLTPIEIPFDPAPPHPGVTIPPAPAVIAPLVEPPDVKPEIIPEMKPDIHNPESSITVISTPEPQPPPVITCAIPTSHPKPPYPRAAERKSIEGTVILRVKIGTDGRPLGVEVKRSSGNELLDGSALSTVRDAWIFSPATEDGVAFESWVEIPVVYTLE